MAGLRSSGIYSLDFKLQVLEEVREGLLSRGAISRKYGIKGNSTITKWMCMFEDKGYALKPADQEKLKRRIRELEKQLEEEKLRRVVAETTIEVAEKEFKISLRKKSDSKQSK